MFGKYAAGVPYGALRQYNFQVRKILTQLSVITALPPVRTPVGNVGIVSGPEPYLYERVSPLQGIPKNLQSIVVSEKSIGDEPASAVVIETRSVADRVL